MIVHHNLRNLIRQPGSRLRSTRSGVQTFDPAYEAATDVIVAAHDSLRLGQQYAPLTETDPSFTGLTLDDKQMIFGEGDVATLLLIWEGTTEETLPRPFWRIVRTPSEEPIDSHPRFATSIGGTAENPLNNAEFDWHPIEGQEDAFPQTGQGSKAFLGFPSGAGNNLDGVSKYLAEKLVVAKEYVSITRPADNFEIPIIRWPSIDQQDRGLNILPPIPLGWNWMQTDLVYALRGNVWEVFEEYTASGSNGWNSIIYPVY